MEVNYTGLCEDHTNSLWSDLTWLRISLHLRMHDPPFVGGELWREHKIVLWVALCVVMYQALNFCSELIITRVIWLCLHQSQAGSSDVLLYPVRAQQEHMLRTEQCDIKTSGPKKQELGENTV
jgi:hypothetical protein